MRFVVCASIALLLAGCQGTGVKVLPSGSIIIPSPPATLVKCFQDGVVLLPEGPYNAEQATQVIVSLRTSEIGKTKCGLELLAYWEDIKKRLADIKG